jgi:carboxypeptidase family protein
MSEKGSTRIWVAVIGAGAIVIPAIIAVLYRGDDNPIPPDVPYSGRVIDKQTQQLIKGATVYVDTRGETQRYYTGDSGTFRVVLSPSIKTVHIRVEATGYKVFDDAVAPAQRNELEDIRLDLNPGRAINLPEGMTLKTAIRFVAGQDDFGVEYTGGCNPRLLGAKVESGPYHGPDMGVIIDQFKKKLINAPPNSSYSVNTNAERKVYQIVCTS